jgi:Fe-S cluster assembly protein SufD
MKTQDPASSRVDRESITINEASFETFLAQRSGEPDWLKDHRQKNWARFLELPHPNRKEENWRFGEPRRLSFGNCSPVTNQQLDESISNGLKTESSLIPSSAARIILANDHCIEEADVPSDLRDSGVIFESFESALLKRPDEIRLHIESELADFGSAKQRSLHAAHCRNGAFLRIPEGVTVEKPFVVYHWIKGSDVAIFPRTIIEAERRSQATIVEVYLSADPQSNAFASALHSVDAAAESSLTRIAVQNLNRKTIVCLTDSNHSKRDAAIRNFNFLLGSSTCRVETTLRVSEPRGDVKVRSMVAATEDQLFDQRSRQDHQAPHTFSDILCKTALMDDSRSIFSGLIRVEENAQLTDAYQTNRNLVIGPNAEANALPGLEILANDVKCSHGATSGTIDEEQLFYLQTRGIPRTAAQQLLTLGFFEEILDEIPSELADSFRILLREKLESNHNDGNRSR